MGLSDLEDTARRTRDNQRRAELLAELRDLEGEGGNDYKPTEFEKSMRTITSKLASPQTIHDKIIHSNWTKNIITNVMMMSELEIGMRKLIEHDFLLVKGDTVFLYKRIDTDSKTIISKTNYKTECYLYRKMKTKSYRSAIFYAEAMLGATGTLAELFMGVEGWRSEQEVNLGGSIANTENQKVTGQNEGALRRGIGWLIGKKH